MGRSDVFTCGEPAQGVARRATATESCYTPRVLNSSIHEAGPARPVQMGMAALALLGLWFVLCRQLSSEWSLNPQYNYGWFVPFFAAFLFWLRWEDRPGERLKAGDRRSEVGGRNGVAIGIAIGALLLLVPVRLFEVANPDWRPLGWVHAFAVIAITFVVIYLAGSWGWVRHFSFPVLFFFVAVPWVTPIEEPIVQGLMRLIASLAAEIASLLGIPAEVQGNLIRIANGVVGVNEACSGVRSLQTSLMIGLLFGELKRLSVWQRIALLSGAVFIALVANLCRAVFLVWIAATREIGAVEHWHDVAGYAIVAVVFLGALGLAAALARDKVGSRNYEVGNESRDQKIGAEAPPLRFLLPTSYFVICLSWLLAVEIGVETWYRVHERNLVALPAWSVRPPENAVGFRELTIDEAVRQTLRFDTAREMTWKTNAGAGAEPMTNYLYFFRWNPGSASVIRARAHRPDLCLPASGWTLVADRGLKNYPTGKGFAVAASHAIFRQTGGPVIVHTFFSLQEDKIRPDEVRPDLAVTPGVQPNWAFPARLRTVRGGVRNLGQQVLEFALLSNRPIADRTAEERFGEIVRELIVTK